MSLQSLTFDELRSKLNYSLITEINGHLRDIKEPGFEKLEWYYITAQKSPYMIPEIGNFILFSHNITLDEFNSLHHPNIVNGLTDGIFYSLGGSDLLEKLYNYFNNNNASLTGAFYFLNLLQLNNEQSFNYNLVIFYFLKELAHYRTTTKLDIFMDHLKYLLDSYYKLMLNPTLQLELYLMDPRKLIDIHAYNMLLLLSLDNQSEIQKFKSFFTKLSKSNEDSEMLFTAAYLLSQDKNIEFIEENYLCVMQAFREMFKNLEIKHRLIDQSFILRLKSGSETALEMTINSFLLAGRVDNHKKRVNEIKNQMKELLNQQRRR